MSNYSNLVLNFGIGNIFPKLNKNSLIEFIFPKYGFNSNIGLNNLI